ncbi:hypothetical protein BV25DRAFT_1583371 [Artomyces pyxidatus]|uniref:Uncharacterized protein n=1 Tax=Artomyces pyxidatus TaxID=48021 RepID=A0ACB8TBX2_9AGAM|nr:hypothetical protein BV25DRAFT_1583371 [Artomyces pyxidatus]
MAVGGIFGSDESDDEGDDADADVDFHNDEEGFEEDDDVYDEESLEDDVYPEHSDMGDSDSDDDSNDEAIPCATQQLILQLYVFKTLAALSPAPALRSLTLCNLIAFGDDIFVLPSFLSLFRGLAHLHISTLSDVENGAHDHRLLEFYMDSLPPMLRAPALSLTSLTLHADQDVDFDLSGLHYPYLKLLSLQRVLFGTETDAEDFILAHGSTLTSLSLLRCKITVPDGERAPSRSWVDVYGNFSAQLVCLRRLEVVEEWEDEGQPNWSSGGRKVRYVWPEPGWGWNPYFPGHVKRDKRALESFRQAVQLRNAWRCRMLHYSYIPLRKPDVDIRWKDNIYTTARV